MARLPLSEPTLSIRFAWPFARLLWNDALTQTLIDDLGVDLAVFGDPDARLPRGVVMRALERAVTLVGDPLIGLRAGQLVEVGEFDVLEYAARSAASFREALMVMARYHRIMMEGVQVSLTVEQDLALWRFRPSDGLVLPAAANDYIVAVSLAFSRRNLSAYVPPLEVRLMHERTAYAAEYERFLETRVVFGAPHNTMVMHESWLAVPMRSGNPSLAVAFEARAQLILDRLQAKDSLAARVREGLLPELRAGPSMTATARRLGMGVATLRRRLEEEGATYSTIVDDVRRELSQHHLAETGPTISEIAFLLGFSDVRAFGRAFRRWTGVSPSEYRAGKR